MRDEGLRQAMSSLLAPSLAGDYPNLPVVSGQGMRLLGADGRQYLDFTSGMAVTSTGHCHPKVVSAAQEQVASLIHGAIGVVSCDTVLELADQLQQILPGDLSTSFFLNSGSEAVEGALRLARWATGRPGIVAFEGCFHGRTMGATSVTSSRSFYRGRYEPLLPSVHFSAFPDAFHLGMSEEEAVDYAVQRLHRLFAQIMPPEQVACFIVEPIQGEGGYNLFPVAFLQELRRLADEHGIVLIFDEIQTGFGRTGSWFAADMFEVVPDVIVLAKAIASGFPLSAVVAPSDLMDRWDLGAHTTTFGGNPVSCAAAVATIEVIREEGLVENSRVMGQALSAGLHQIAEESDRVADVRGAGLMVGMEFADAPGKKDAGAVARAVFDRCLERGLLLYFAGPQGEVLRFLPALVVDDRDLEEALDITRDAVMAST